MIIGISGYSGSGKDTLGRIIQYIMGGKGPDGLFSFSIEKAIANPLEFDEVLEDSSEWEIKKFAGKLKDIASHLTGIDIEDFEDQEFKKTNLGREWWTTCDEGWQPMTVREFLQKLGTDALRTGLHPNVWVNALMADYDEDSNWVITDTRFPNEAMAIKEKGGIIIRIDRPGFKPINDHPSEIALNGWNFDYKIANVSDLISLTFTVETILKHAKII
jgi:hypothetical protein